MWPIPAARSTSALSVQEGGHHDLDDYATRGKEPQDEVQMYTWTDATLRELTDLVKEVQTAARNPRARLQFALIYPDRQGKNVLRQVGAVEHTLEYYCHNRVITIGRERARITPWTGRPQDAQNCGVSGTHTTYMCPPSQ